MSVWGNALCQWCDMLLVMSDSFPRKGHSELYEMLCTCLSVRLHAITLVKRSLPGNGSMVDIKQMFNFLYQSFV